jgi:hypothetical protein
MSTNQGLATAMTCSAKEIGQAHENGKWLTPICHYDITQMFKEKTISLYSKRHLITEAQRRRQRTITFYLNALNMFLTKSECIINFIQSSF